MIINIFISKWNTKIFLNFFITVITVPRSSANVYIRNGIASPLAHASWNQLGLQYLILFLGNNDTVWKVSKYEVIFVPYFLAFSPNTGNYWPEVTPYQDGQPMKAYSVQQKQFRGRGKFAEIFRVAICIHSCKVAYSSF